MAMTLFLAHHHPWDIIISSNFLASDNTYKYIILNFSSICLIHFNITVGNTLLGPFLLIKTIKYHLDAKCLVWRNKELLTNRVCLDWQRDFKYYYNSLVNTKYT